MGKRLQRLRQTMRSHGYDAVLLTCEVNQSWCSGLDFTDGYILVCENAAYIITDPRYIEALRAKADSDFECLCELDTFDSTILRCLSANGAKTLGVEDKEASYYDLCRIERTVAPCQVMPLGSLLDTLRAQKDEDEAEKIRTAQRITDAAFSHVLGYIKEGVTETDIAIELEFFMRRQGASARSFDFIVASGSTSSCPHAVPRSVPIEKGFLTLDFGCVCDGYCSDMTRTVFLGLADADMKRLYNTVLRAQTAAIDFITEGVLCSDADTVARRIIDVEYPGRFLHSLGHGVGRRIHEMPRLSSKTTDRRLLCGDVVTVEPGIYIEGKYGCRIEDMLIIGKGCAENITKSSKELIEL